MADAPDEPRAKDLFQAGALTPPPPPGHVLVARLEARERRRPVGNSPRLWLRVVGEDPFLSWAPVEDMRRKTVYVDGRFERLDQADKDAERKKHDHRPVPPPQPRAGGDEPGRSGNQGESLIPAAFRNIPTAAPTAARPTNQGDSLIPPAFRNIPTAAPTAARPTNQGDSLIPPAFRNIPAAEAPSHKANMGEALIPAAFRDLPVAKPEPPRRPKLEPQPVTLPEPAEPASRAPNRPGRPQRQRRVIRTPRQDGTEPEAEEFEAEAPSVAEAPFVEPPAAPRGPDPTSLDDLFSVPAERLALGRSGRRTPPTRGKPDQGS
jgi:hypothetical protein